MKPPVAILRNFFRRLERRSRIANLTLVAESLVLARLRRIAGLALGVRAQSSTVEGTAFFP